ncbi:hypothetical protein N657DRAFT_639856 [Parathielavia appendiculata]|uniref:Uncharacterized protein n=1 Tax=Parathielavia appendiculata TaxID=2587402 RepID=A0AAN6UCW7_9PEZI|nr:hypothetical protein N657DRAFT_639856 [Parathielavia appendiculata]
MSARRKNPQIPSLPRLSNIVQQLKWLCRATVTYDRAYWVWIAPAQTTCVLFSPLLYPQLGFPKVSEPLTAQYDIFSTP